MHLILREPHVCVLEYLMYPLLTSLLRLVCSDFIPYFFGYKTRVFFLPKQYQRSRPV